MGIKTSEGLKEYLFIQSNNYTDLNSQFNTLYELYGRLYGNQGLVDIDNTNATFSSSLLGFAPSGVNKFIQTLNIIPYSYPINNALLTTKTELCIGSNYSDTGNVNINLSSGESCYILNNCYSD